MQAALAAYIFHRRKAWGVNVYTGQRARVRPGKYKLPDVCIVRGPRPTTPIFEQPPLVAIEILSPEDRPLRVDQTIAEWLEFGVGFVWVVDPETLESVLTQDFASFELVICDDASSRAVATPPGVAVVRAETAEEFARRWNRVFV